MQQLKIILTVLVLTLCWSLPALSQTTMERFGPEVVVALTQTVGEMQATLAAMEDPRQTRALSNKLDAWVRMLEHADVRAVSNKLLNDIYPRSASFADSSQIGLSDLVVWMLEVLEAAPLQVSNVGNLIGDPGAVLPPGPDPLPVMRLGRHYRARPDERDCAFPACGGIWVREVNRPLTRCADGSYQNECYAATADWRRLGLNADDLERFLNNLYNGQALTQAVLVSRQWPGIGSYGHLIAAHGWRAMITVSAPLPAPGAASQFFGLRDTGVICITFPCYNIEEKLLNTRFAQLISGIDFSKSGLSIGQQAQVRHAVNMGTFIGQGYNLKVPDQGPAGDGIDLVLSRAFLLVQPSVVADSADFTGTYLVTLAYEDGRNLLGSLTLAQGEAVVSVRLVDLDNDKVYVGFGIIVVEGASQVVYWRVMHSDNSSEAKREPTSLTFNGRGIDLNADEKVDTIAGDFWSDECTDTCEEVVGDFDAYVE